VGDEINLLVVGSGRIQNLLQINPGYFIDTQHNSSVQAKFDVSIYISIFGISEYID
jgi:hypothetical protein